MAAGVPPKLTKQDFALPEGLNLRQAVILSAAISIAAVVAFAVQGALPLRAFLAALIAGTGLALAYKTIQGEPLEVWIVRTIMFNLRARKMIWRRGGGPRPRGVQEPEPAPRPAPAPSLRWHRPVAPEVAEDVSFITAMANVLIFAILSGLSVYMATGGAKQLLSYADYLGGR
jgi:hypothetical protein